MTKRPARSWAPKDGAVARQLTMGGLLPPEKPYNMLIQPLYLRDEQLGLVMFEQKPAGDVYEVLRDEISATLKAVMLAERNVALYQQALEAEKVAQEGRRLAEKPIASRAAFCRW